MLGGTSTGWSISQLSGCQGLPQFGTIAARPRAHLSSGTSSGPKVSYSVRVPIALTRAARRRQ